MFKRMARVQSNTLARKAVLPPKEGNGAKWNLYRDLPESPSFTGKVVFHFKGYLFPQGKLE